ncbi:MULTISPECIES: Rid family hydrolase [Mycobacteriaceae]|uniref:Rid family hydrolase n=1 Tax=Mycolicibacillus parakoreensis TaxID=1069221 RepID=A0ABY3U2E2_9MYCO|nr:MULTISPECIES: Rid family hydrolase [Mycobacteriaceae]MCV7316625.1 hypothetical protein [Mycolicibacillus parakoreensis]ULN52836.1 Rid family hydrolase [Mycolicibacillus parakoreensis]HLR98375.1 Rid family hydrolase [Mycolicibacillus parakoreensis]
MTDRKFFTTPEFTTVFAMASRIGNRVELAGQGGWLDNDMNFPESLRDEIAQAFANVGTVLQRAGASFDDVIDVHSYHVGLDGNQDFINDTMAECFAEHMPHHAPTWTNIGVAALGHARMRVEIRVVAVTA